MGKIIEKAKMELELAGYNSSDDGCGMNRLMAENVLKLLEVFSQQGHSGMSASFCISLFEKLAKQEPISPLTGNDEEWMEALDGTLQNKRCFSVFKNADGKAYDIDGRVFRDKDGSCYTNKDSRVYITFPYTPKTEYVDFSQSEFGN